MKKQVLTLLLLTSLVRLSIAQSLDIQTFASIISTKSIQKNLYFIASDSMKGRDTGSEGQKTIANYIAGNFSRFRLTPPLYISDTVKSYFQPFIFTNLSKQEVYLKAGKHKFDAGSAFFIQGRTHLPEEINTEIVFAGYGIESEHYSDYHSIDVKGKAVIILAEEPLDKSGNSLITKKDSLSDWTNNFQKKAITAKSKGAKYVFITTSRKKEYQQLLREENDDYFSLRRTTFDGRESINSKTIFVLAPETAQKILGVSQSEIFKDLVNFAERKPSNLQVATIQFKATFKEFGTAYTENVMGLIEGTDKKDEIVIVSAHYDHVGVNNGQIYNGADDNASGTSALLELSKAFAQAKFAGLTPRRSILFIAFCAEEKGLQGSNFYTHNSPFSLQKTVANLNIDMIGRDEAFEDKNSLYLVGNDQVSKQFAKICEEQNKKYTRLNLYRKFGGFDDPEHSFNRSDQYHFAKYGIPALFLHAGEHPDYHQPTDDPEKINYEKLQRITQLAFYTIWEIATMEERIK